MEIVLHVACKYLKMKKLFEVIPLDKDGRFSEWRMRGCWMHDGISDHPNDLLIDDIYSVKYINKKDVIGRAHVEILYGIMNSEGEMIRDRMLLCYIKKESAIEDVMKLLNELNGEIINDI